MRVIHLDDLQTTRWSGGTTTELAIYPPAASYGGRDFIWRLSSAEVEEAESIFTSLPDYRRLLMLRKGTLRLCHDGGDWYELAPGQAVAFDGASDTRSRGFVTDFNLMLRKGKAEGALACVKVTGAERGVLLTALFTGWKTAPAGSTLALFLSEGGPVTLEGEEWDILHAGELALFDEASAAAGVQLSAEKEGVLIGAVISGRRK